MFRVLVLCVLAVLFTGCSLFSGTVPRSAATIGRSAADADGDVVKNADAIIIDNKWAADNFTMDVKESYEAGPNGSELLKERSIFFTRNTDPTVAGEVAKVRAGASERVAIEGIEAAATVGTSVITGQATGAVGQLLEDVTNGEGSTATEATEAATSGR